MAVENDLYRQAIAKRLDSSSSEIADEWLKRLDEIIDEQTRDIFPTDLLLDHIPSLIQEIAKIIESPQNDLAVSSSLIARKAKSLGELRHEQNASVHQLLREYDVLAKILEEFIIQESEKYDGEIQYQDSIHVMSNVAHVVRMILQATVDTFIEKYMEKIDSQTDRLVEFNKFLSHELKNPMQAALLNSELLLDGKSLEDKETKEILAVKTSIQQAVLLLRNIEQVSKVDNEDSASPIIQEVDIVNVVNNISMQLEEMLNGNGIELKIKNDLGKITLEIAKLELILTNIITNAVKYSDLRKDDKYIHVERIQSEDDQLILMISDNGLGIDDDMHEEVFKLRVRAHEDTDEGKNIEGHGLGLYLAQEAAENLRGTISLESKVGEGSKFIIKLPK